MMNEQMMFNKATVIAAKAHFGQVRTGTGEPYITHPIAVSQILLDYGCSAITVVVGILHDVLEDTEDRVQRAEFAAEIKQTFGNEVLTAVYGVSKISCKQDGSRAKRVQVDIEHYCSGSDIVHNVKLADVLHNLSTTETLDHKFAVKYIKEKDLLVAELERIGSANEELLSSARSLINELLIFLEI